MPFDLPLHLGGRLAFGNSHLCFAILLAAGLPDCMAAGQFHLTYRNLCQPRLYSTNSDLQHLLCSRLMGLWYQPLHICHIYYVIQQVYGIGWHLTVMYYSDWWRTDHWYYSIGGPPLNTVIIPTDDRQTVQWHSGIPSALPYSSDLWQTDSVMALEDPPGHCSTSNQQWTDCSYGIGGPPLHCHTPLSKTFCWSPIYGIADPPFALLYSAPAKTFSWTPIYSIAAPPFSLL